MTTFPHVRLQAEGTLGKSAKNEIWSCGLKIGLTLSGSPDTLVAASQTDVDELASVGVSAWTTYIGGPGSGAASLGTFSEWANLLLCRAAAVVSSGHDDPALHSTISDVISDTHGYYTVIPGTQFGGEVPYGTSLVCTLKGSTYPRGSAAYGRFYPPVPSLWSAGPSDTGPRHMINGLVDPLVAQNLADQTANMLITINAATLTSGKIPFVANIGRSEDIAGTRWQPVTSVVVDTRPDSVRRRYNKVSGVTKADFPV